MARFRKRDREEAAGFGGETGDSAETGFLGDEGLAASSGRLTPVQVQEKVFRLGFRGYSEREVDEFLDLVTEELAGLHEENKRLREEIELRGGGAPAEDVSLQAEEMLREAREEAARILSQAEAGSGGAGPGISAAFLSRERDFLQELAQLVQSHADALRGEATRVRQEAAKPAKTKPPAKTKAKPEPVPEPEAREEPPADADPAPVPKGPSGGSASLDDDEEPSLRELFWGEE